MELWINLGAPLIHVDTHHGVSQIPQALVGGLHSRAFSMRFTGKVCLVGAFIKPGAAAVLLNDRTDPYKNTFIPAESVFTTEIDCVTDRLRKLSNLAEIAECLETFLMSNLVFRKEPRYFANIQKILEMINTKHGSITLKDVHEQAYMGQRNFRRLFTEYVGFNPKEYSRIVRVKHVLRLLRCGMSIPDVAFKLGYHDPAHLSNDFSRIAGVSPSKSQEHVNSLDLEYLNRPSII
jgi:AraC-like DNA-binding protein